MIVTKDGNFSNKQCYDPVPLASESLLRPLETLEKVVIIVYNDIEVLADETDCKDMILRYGPSALAQSFGRTSQSKVGAG
jgi:hypothetical protein